MLTAVRNCDDGVIHHRPWSATCIRDEAPAPFDYYSSPGNPTVRADVAPELKQQFSDYIVSYGHNTMTWQLGDHMHAQHRTVSDEDALAAAKSFLESMD